MADTPNETGLLARGLHTMDLFKTWMKLSPVFGQNFGATDVKFLRRLKDAGFAPSVIFDVGASNAPWTVAARTVFPDVRYEMFEPQANTNPTFQKGLERVRGLPNVTIHTCALSDRASTAQLHVMGRRGTGASLIGKGHNASEHLDVAVETIDRLIDANTVPVPDMIKLDIQGGELAALRGAIRNALPHASVLALELWLKRSYGPDTPLMVELIEFLNRRGFLPFEFGDEYRTPNGCLTTKDVWFVRANSELAKHIWATR